MDKELEEIETAIWRLPKIQVLIKFPNLLWAKSIRIILLDHNSSKNLFR